jgi:hypothetical protein
MERPDPGNGTAVQVARRAGAAHVQAAHFGALRRLNSYEHCGATVVVGREQPSPQAIEALTRPFAQPMPSLSSLSGSTSSGPAGDACVAGSQISPKSRCIRTHDARPYSSKCGTAPTDGAEDQNVFRGAVKAGGRPVAIDDRWPEPPTAVAPGSIPAAARSALPGLMALAGDAMPGHGASIAEVSRRASRSARSEVLSTCLKFRSLLASAAVPARWPPLVLPPPAPAHLGVASGARSSCARRCPLWSSSQRSPVPVSSG